MKLHKLIVLAIIAATLLTLNCKKEEKDDSTTNFLLVYLLDQASGNCATITKNTAGTLYTATGSGVPKGGCNEATLGRFAETSAAAKAISDSNFDARINELKKYTECSAQETTQTANKIAVTTTTIETAANNATNGCTTVGGNGFLGATNFCKDAASLSALKALTRYVAISSARTDMEANYSGQQTANAALNTTTGYTSAALLNLRLANSTEIALISSFDIAGAWVSGLGTSCGAKVIASNATFKAYLEKVAGFVTSHGTEITNANRAAVSETITNNLTCRYGSTATASTTVGTTAGVGLCPTATAPTTYSTF